MKKQLKVYFVFALIILLTGCLETMTPSEKVEELFNMYIKNDESIMNELDTYLDSENLSEEQKKRYKNIVKDEYSSIVYEIKNEIIDGNDAEVEVLITVKDLYKAGKEAEEYLISNISEFYTDGMYDQDKFIDYKLSLMEQTTETVSYTIYINLSLDDDVWVINELGDENLEKIHGIYNYDADE